MDGWILKFPFKKCWYGEMLNISLYIEIYLFTYVNQVAEWCLTPKQLEGILKIKMYIYKYQSTLISYWKYNSEKVH